MRFCKSVLQKKPSPLLPPPLCVWLIISSNRSTCTLFSGCLQGTFFLLPFFFPLHGSTIHHYSTVISICKYQRAMKTNSSFLCCWVSSCLVQNLNNKLRNKSPWPAQSFSSCAEYIQHSSHATSESASLPFQCVKAPSRVQHQFGCDLLYGTGFPLRYDLQCDDLTNDNHVFLFFFLPHKCSPIRAGWMTLHDNWVYSFTVV